MSNLLQLFLTAIPLDAPTTFLLGGAAVGTTIGLNQIVGKKLILSKERLKDFKLMQPIKKICRSNGAWLLHDVVIPQYDSSMTIPWMIVSQQGIIIINTVHNNSKIFGLSNDVVWHQVNASGIVLKIENPMTKTDKIVKTLKYQIKSNGMPYIPVYSMVIYSDEGCQIQVDDDRIFSVESAEMYLNESIFLRAKNFKPKELLKTMDNILISYSL